MLAYFSVYVFIVIISFLISIVKEKSVTKLLLFSLIILFSLLYFFRDYNIGTDTQAYVHYFDILKRSKYSEVFELSQLYKIEFGFLFFSKFLVDIFPNYHYLFLFYSIIVYCLMVKVFIKSKSNFLILCISLFSVYPLFFYNFNILRQSISIALIIYSVSCLFDNQKNKFFLVVFLSSFIHFASIISILFYFVYKKSDFLYKHSISLSVIFFSIFLITFKFSEVLFGKYYHYFSVAEAVEPFSLITLFFYFSVYFYSVYVINNYGKFYDLRKITFYNIILLVFLVYNIILNFTGLSNQGLNRLGFYFSWVVIFLVPEMLKFSLKKQSLVILYIFIFLFYSFWFVYSVGNFGDDLVPFTYY